MFPVRCVTYVPGLYPGRANHQLEPTRRLSFALMSRRRAAQLDRLADSTRDLPRWIEFHDSTLTAIKQSAGMRESPLTRAPRARWYRDSRVPPVSGKTVRLTRGT
jgi:hypothetical protein